MPGKVVKALDRAQLLYYDPRMLVENIQEGLTFDDVLIVPAHSAVTPAQVELKTRLTDDISLTIPFLSAAMDTVTESRLAIAIAEEGGIGIIHKNWSIEEQAFEVMKVKKHEGGVVTDPITVSPDQTLEEIGALAREMGVTGFPVVDQGILIGLITNRDRQFEENPSRRVGEVMTPRERLIVGGPDIILEAAKALLHQHRIEKLPIVDAEFRLKGLMTTRDIKRVREHPGATKDSSQRLRVGAAIGIGAAEQKRAAALIASGVDLLVVDTAHGHSQGVLEMVKSLRKAHPHIALIAGNVATAEGTQALIDAGVSAVKVGVGPGSICTTRIVAGCGVPQLTAISSCAEVAKKRNIPLIADGGIKYSGDLAKAIAAGASAVMIGSLFAGTEEAPGEIIMYQGRSYKVYRGMGSILAMQKGSKDRYAQGEVRELSKLVPEGIEGRVPYRGRLRDMLYQLSGGLRAGMGYAGCKTIHELQTKTKFIRITSAALRESHVHDVIITKEAPNYQVDH